MKNNGDSLGGKYDVKLYREMKHRNYNRSGLSML